MPITSTGLGSGLDIESLVSQLVIAETTSDTQRLAVQESRYQAEISAYGQLQSAVSTFKSDLNIAVDPDSYQSFNAISNNSDLITASASTDALAGNYDINVSALADEHSLVAGSYAAETTTVGTGTLTFTLGTTTYDSGANTYSFTQKSGTTPVAITIDSSNNTLLGVRDAINAANAGVEASIVHDGSNYRLVMTAKDTGAENSLQVSVVDGDGNHTDSSGLSALTFDSTARQSTQLVAGTNAALTINGLAISSASNTVSKALTGVELTLKGLTTSAVNVSVERDLVTATNAVNNFVAGYNNLTSVINNLTSYDSARQSGSVLTGDATTRTLQNGLRSILNQVVTEASGTHTTLAGLGITTTVADGTLSVDSSKLDAALKESPVAVGQIFTRLGTSNSNSLSYVSSTDSTKAGSYAVTFDGTNGTIGGIAASVDGTTLTGSVGSTVEGLKVNVASGATGSIGTISYAVGLASQLQSFIDGLLADDGLFDARTTGVQSSIEDIADQRLALEQRMLKIEARYRSQFLTMDTLLNDLQGTSNFLTGALDKFPDPMSFKK